MAELGLYFAAANALISGSASAQKLLSLANPAGSAVTLRVARAWAQGTMVAAVAPFLYKSSLSTDEPSGGTILDYMKRHESDTAPVGVVRVSPTVTLAAGNAGSGCPGAAFGLTLAGCVSTGVLELLERQLDEDGLYIPAGKALVIHADANDADWRHVAGFTWRETS